MNKPTPTYIAIDLKSFYASVECNELKLNPLTTNLVVADKSRTEKTICLAVSPSLKSYGVPGRARLFEVIEKVREINRLRLLKAPHHTFTGESSDDERLKSDPSLKLSFEIAKPRMSLYMKYSASIYKLYLKYIAPEDIHVYSIDEVFMDVTNYLSIYKLTPHELAKRMIQDVLENTGITATAGIGTNLYLCKIAMDIGAKHIEPDEDGVRIAELDELSYRRLLWAHTPITDFWRVGRGTARKLYEHGLYTMGDVARCSLGKPSDFHNEELLYKLFGINAELLIDHAWGFESCTMEHIKAYKPEDNSIGSGQVLSRPYTYDETEIVVREMTDLLVLDLVSKHLTTDQIVLTIGYDSESLNQPGTNKKYNGEVSTDWYGRSVPKHAHGSVSLGRHTSSTRIILDAVTKLYADIVNPNLLVKRIYITANHIVNETSSPKGSAADFEQLDLFTDYGALERQRADENKELEREKAIQKATLEIQKKFGKNALLRGSSLQDGATAMERNIQIGGHNAG